jgi:hypothetical protein
VVINDNGVLQKQNKTSAKETKLLNCSIKMAVILVKYLLPFKSFPLSDYDKKEKDYFKALPCSTVHVNYDTSSH